MQAAQGKKTSRLGSDRTVANLEQQNRELSSGTLLSGLAARRRWIATAEPIAITLPAALAIDTIGIGGDVLW